MPLQPPKVSWIVRSQGTAGQWGKCHPVMISLLTGLLLCVRSEKARRRDPRLYSYLAIPCEATKQVGDARFCSLGSSLVSLFPPPLPLHHPKRAAA
jgi:hypothetical protein